MLVILSIILFSKVVLICLLFLGIVLVSVLALATEDMSRWAHWNVMLNYEYA